MKKILTLIVASMLALSSQSFAKDFGDYKIDAELGYSMDGWTAAGTDMNSARPVAYANLDIEYNGIENFRFLLENSVSEIEDDTTSDGSHSMEYGHRLTATYFINDFDLGIFGEVSDSNDTNTQGDHTSYQGIEAGYTVDGYRFGYEYGEELTDGFIVDGGTAKYLQDYYVISLEKTYNILGKNVEMEATYFDADNLRETIALDVEVHLTDNVGFGLLAGENDGKGVGANSAGQNRDFAAARVFVKY